MSFQHVSIIITYRIYLCGNHIEQDETAVQGEDTEKKKANVQSILRLCKEVTPVGC